MTEILLGLHAGVNATVALAVDGRLVSCVQEERLTRIKGYMGFPHQALDAALGAVGAAPGDVAAVAYGSRSGPVDHCPRDVWLHRLQGFHRRASLADDEARLVAADPAGMDERLRHLLAERGLSTVPIRCFDHHTTHGAAAYFGLRTSTTRPYLVLTCDGFGDGACATVAVHANGHRTEIARTGMRDSLGLLWFWLTHAYGFVPHEDEFKLMGMAPYGRPDRAATVAGIFARHLSLDDTGLCLRRRDQHSSIERSWPAIAADLRGLRFDDVFAGLQTFTDDLLAAWVRHAVQTTGIPDVLAGGGVFMNVKTNQRLAALDCVQTFAAFPSCGDESLAVGALWSLLAERHGQQHVAPLASCYLGDDITDTDVEAATASTGLRVHRPDDIHAAVAQLLAEGTTVARCAGRMEYGARALGNRSILADPADADLPRRLNRLVKQRDFWMPFAPAMLASQQERYIINPKRLASPFMMLGFPTVPGAAEAMIAAVHPADLTCRPQLVGDHDGSGLAAILTAYHRRTGQAVLLNTSLNLHGEPIARTAADAVRILLHSELTHLQLGGYLVTKPVPPPGR